MDTNDYVLHPSIDGVRGQVLWVEDGDAYVCWETGYEPYVRHRVRDLKKTTVLDLLVTGREVNFKHEPLRARCKCGLKLQPAAKGKKLVCSRCKIYFTLTGQPL